MDEGDDGGVRTREVPVETGPDIEESPALASISKHAADINEENDEDNEVSTL